MISAVHQVVSKTNINKVFFSHFSPMLNQKLNPIALVRKRTIPTKRPPLAGEVSDNFCG
jgi:hypothetical protein